MSTQAFQKGTTSVSNKNPDGTKCNWWCRKKSKLLGVLVGLVTGGPVVAIIAASSLLSNEGDDTAWNDSALFRTYSTDIPLTVTEETKLDALIDSYFIPFYNALVLKVDGAIVTKAAFRTSGNPVIANVNEVRKQIAILKVWLQHTTTHPPVGYTQNMLLARNGFINEQLEVLEKAIADYLASKNVTAAAVKTSVAVGSVANTYGMVYNWQSKGLTANYNKINETEVIQDLHSDPVDIIITDEIAEAIQTVTPTNSNQQQPTGSSTGGKIMKVSVIALISFLIGKAASSKKKSK